MRLFCEQSEDNYLFSLTRMILEQLPTIVEDDQEVSLNTDDRAFLLGLFIQRFSV